MVKKTRVTVSFVDRRDPKVFNTDMNNIDFKAGFVAIADLNKNQAYVYPRERINHIIVEEVD